MMNSRKPPKPMTLFLGVCSATLAMTLSLGSAVADQRDLVRVPALTTKFGVGTFEQIVAFERLIAARHPWLRLVAQESPGFVYNLKEMTQNPKRKTTSVAMSSTGALWAAATGQKGFFEKKLPSDDLRWLITRSGNCLWFVTTDPELKSVKQFSGRRIGMGLRSQTHPGLFSTLMIETGASVTGANLEYLGSAGALTSLLDGKVEAAASLTGITSDMSLVVPGGALRRFESAGRDYYHIGYPAEMVEKINKELGAPFEAVTLPANSLANQPNPVDCLADYTVMVAHKDFPKDVAYAITKTMAEINTDVAKYIGAGKLYRKDTICVVPKGVLPHPGAVEACKELGLMN
jgi:TRAP transporter TAXI family solute receptor